MATIAQTDSVATTRQLSAKSNENNADTSNNPLQDSPHSSIVTTDEAHETSAQRFAQDTDDATRARWASRWKSSLRVGGHFLQGIFGIAAFRAAYVRARGHVGEHRTGPMQVRYAPDRAATELDDGERTQQQARIAGWSELIGALPTIPLSVATAVVGGILGLCAKAHRAYQQDRMRDDNKYEQTRDRLIAAAMRRNGAQKASGDSKTNLGLQVMVVEEMVKRAADCWRTACLKDPATPVTESTLMQQITRMVEAFHNLATTPPNHLDGMTLSHVLLLAEKWTQTADEAEKDELVDQIADTVELWKAHRHICTVSKNVVNSMQWTLLIDPDDQFNERPLRLKPYDFQSAYDSIVEHAFKNRPNNDGSAEQARTVAENEIRGRVFQKWESQPPHSLYKIVTTID